MEPGLYARCRRDFEEFDSDTSPTDFLLKST
jgi:hypothetical protein